MQPDKAMPQQKVNYYKNVETLASHPVPGDFSNYPDKTIFIIDRKKIVPLDSFKKEETSRYQVDTVIQDKEAKEINTVIFVHSKQAS